MTGKYVRQAHIHLGRTGQVCISIIKKARQPYDVVEGFKQYIIYLQHFSGLSLWCVRCKQAVLCDANVRLFSILIIIIIIIFV